MAQPLDATQAKYSNYSNYSNYSKLAAGKFRDLFGGQFFFDTTVSALMVSRQSQKVTDVSPMLNANSTRHQ